MPVIVIVVAEGAAGTQFTLHAIVVLGGDVVGAAVVAVCRVVGEAVAVSRSTATALFWSAEVVVVRDPTRRPVQLVVLIVLSRTYVTVLVARLSITPTQPPSPSKVAYAAFNEENRYTETAVPVAAW